MPTSVTFDEIRDVGCERAMLLAPTIKLLGEHGASWQEYAGPFPALLCIENTAEHCDRRLVL